MTRRKALGISAKTAACLTLSSTLTPVLTAAPDQRRFKIGACDWSLGKHDVSSLELAKKIGLDGVEVDMGGPANHLYMRQPAVQKEYAETSKKLGVELASLALGSLNEVPLKSEPHTVVWLLDTIAACQNLGIKVILMAFFGNGELLGDKAGTDRVVEVFKEVAPRAEKAGVILGFENYLSAEANIAILDHVGSPALQVYYDVGNSTDKGYDIYKEIPLLGKRICQFHFKDAGFLLGKGRIDFKKVRAAMDEIGYHGWIHIEAAAPNGLMVDYPANLAFLRGLFPANG